MPDPRDDAPPAGALASLGWDDRVAAGYAAVTAPGLVAARVVRVEREAAMAWDGGARPVVLVTKADVATPDQIADLQARLGTVEIVATSVRNGDGLPTIRRLLQPNRTAALLGPSGAGKSSLANALVGRDRMATSAVRDADHRGRHTTTWRQLLVVPGGGVLVDTPGLRSLSMAGMGAGIAAAFDDVATLAESCRFRDCSHQHEPGCAVKAALAAGQLDPDRLANYLKLADELATAAAPSYPSGRGRRSG